MATVSKLGLDDGVFAGLNAAALRRRMAAVADDRDLARRVFEARGNPEAGQIHPRMRRSRRRSTSRSAWMEIGRR